MGNHHAYSSRADCCVLVVCGLRKWLEWGKSGASNAVQLFTCLTLPLYQQFYSGDVGRDMVHVQQRHPGLYYTLVRRDAILRAHDYSDDNNRSMVDFYDTNPTQSFGKRCRSGRPKRAARFRSKVVYAFVHLSALRGHKRYVGSVHTQGHAGARCAFVRARAREHLQAARAYIRVYTCGYTPGIMQQLGLINLTKCMNICNRRACKTW